MPTRRRRRSGTGVGRPPSAAALLCVTAVVLGGCFRAQEAAGCNDPGVFGCRHEPGEPVEPERRPRRAPDTPNEDAG